MEKNEIKKELLKTKVNAIFSHYCAGNLYYNVAVQESVYQFSISVFESDGETLSHDLGTTNFDESVRASYLNRWVDKSIEAGTFVKVS